MSELALLFRDLDEAVIYQEEPIRQAHDTTTQVNTDAGKVIHHLDEANKSARRTRRLKWWTLLTIVLIICALALILGVYFGVTKKK